MTVRSPLVLVGGKIEELPASDVILGAPAGPTGATGSTGPAGVAATISVGTVTTLSAGSSATVSNSGTSSAAVFNFGIPQGAAGTSGITLISEVITASSATTVHFATIAQTYRHLQVWWCARDSGSGGAAEAFIKLNSDGTAGNYATVVFGGSGASGTTTVSGSNGPKCLLVPGSTTATALGSGCLTIRNYTNTTFRKTISVDHEDNTSIKRVSTTSWASTAAVTDILITCPITSFVNGSIFQLYGIN